MDPRRRRPFNEHWSDRGFAQYRDSLTSALGPIPFRLAETPLFLTRDLSDQLKHGAMDIVNQLSDPATFHELKHAIPAQYDVPGMGTLPDCVQVDFALVQTPEGRIVPRLVELQAFPSLYALQTFEADAWEAVLRQMPGLEGDWTCFFDEDRASAVELMRRCILGGHDPKEVALVDFEPPKQKTAPDFVATKKLFDVDAVCVTELEKEGRRLYRRVDGKRVQVKRIYNRMVFDELEVKKVPVPFSWNEELDVSWCSHPNWYWVWSKYSLPFLDHPTVPKARYLDEFTELPPDLENYVLKPLFSFAGSGVVVDVTKEAIDAVPAELRHKHLMQRKVQYAWGIDLPPGMSTAEAPGVKAEVRVMLMRGGPGEPLHPLLPLVRLSRGKMLGVDQNRSADTLWTGGSVGIWKKGP